VPWLFLPLLCGLIFFWPERSIPNVDDLFFVPWAQEFAGTGRHWNALLAVQFPGLETYHLQPRLHLIAAGWFFAVAGSGTGTLLLFEFLCYALTSLVFSAVCLRLGLRLAAVFTPLLFAPCYVVAGFRLELTGSFLFLLGLLLCLPLIVKASDGGRGQSGRETAGVVAGLAVLGIAPLAAPAVFAWSLGAVAVLSLWRLMSRQAAFLRILGEGLAALVLALAVFALSVDFEFAEFFEQVTYHASRSTGGGLNDEALGRAALFAAVAGLLMYRRHRAPALLCFVLAAGQGLAAFLHDKALIRNLAASMVFLIAADAAMGRRWRKAKVAAFALVFLVLSANFFSFYLLSRDVENREAVLSVYREDVGADKRVFIDEVMAQHFLDQQTGGALAWTWGGTFPKGRPTGINDLEDGDVWYVSEYTLRGYLKGRHDVAERLWKQPDYARVPQIPCLLGRHSCNLPRERWTMLRLERDGERVLVEELGAGSPPRPVSMD